jgi:hypothetical protein
MKVIYILKKYFDLGISTWHCFRIAERLPLAQFPCRRHLSIVGNIVYIESSIRIA